MAKTAKKTAKSPRNGAEIPLGAHPGNTGGKKGRSGRKPFAFKALCREILTDAATQKSLRRAAQSPGLPGYSGVVKMLASYAAGLPVQPVKHSGAVDLRLADQMKRARARVR